MKKQYSLWIAPSRKVQEEVAETITGLSKRLNSPNFEPHVTLIGQFESEEKEAVDQIKKLASSIKPFVIEFSEISFSTTYFQSVFLRVKSSSELMEANLKAKKMLSLKNDVFMPHMSITYGNQTMKERERITSEIKMPENDSFMFNKLILVLTSDEPKEWKQISRVELKG